ncbi:MAG: hypothetical protein K0R27_1459 [Xanthobacteraceae bacterium]|jgi:hypothetical protein|nr:hypothetical protein [Xanthobacteraceae bacterium]
MRLDDPDEESFIYFACRLREDDELCGADPDLLISRNDFTDAGADAVLAHVRTAYESRKLLHRRALEIAIAEQGFDPTSPGTHIAVECFAEVAAAYSLQKSLQLPHPPERKPDGQWRPRRSTARAVALGAWLATGAKSYSAAACELNLHRPRVEEVTRFEVMRAVENEIARLARPRGDYRDRPLELYRLVARLGVFDHRVTMALWGHLHSTKGRKRIDMHWQSLRRDGQLFAMRAKLEDTVLVTSPEFDVEVESAATTIHARVLALLMRAARQHGLFEKAGELAGATHTPRQ